MNDFFQTLFGWLSSMYEQGWDNFLSDKGAYTYFGLILLIVPSIIAGIFYFIYCSFSWQEEIFFVYAYIIFVGDGYHIRCGRYDISKCRQFGSV